MKTKRILSGLLSLALCLGLCACGEDKAQETVSVQSVGLITGIGSVGLAERFAGIVDAGESIRVEKDEKLRVKELLVSVGDTVEEGQILLTYDIETMSLDLDTLRLELEQLKAARDTKSSQIETLEKEKERARSEEQLGYTLQIQELQIDVTKAGLDITAKEKEIERMEALLENDRVLSPASGRIKSINENGGADERGEPLPFLTIQQTETFRIKGTINEQNAGVLDVGTPVTIRSRMDDSLWTGVVETIDYDNPVQQDGGYYYYGGGKDEMSTSSKYSFYVTLDSDEGLMLGQHVYIEPGIHTGPADKLQLPAWCICDADSDKPWVWAATADEKLEKRSLELGEYDADMDCWEVLAGVSLQDYLATPGDNCKEGAPVVFYSESDFDVPEGTMNFGDEGGKAAVDDGAYKDGEFGVMPGEGEEAGIIYDGAGVGSEESGDKVIYGGAIVPAGGEGDFSAPTQEGKDATGGAAG
ncbi:MAG: HlyD family efflux transporter periplasmic adaptor subunit [Oscillospiraceae bacterium]|nr:HlyD family efflux transporter periplasmic adaptor subunit [Oscillospiraceae bacterium]